MKINLKHLKVLFQAFWHSKAFLTSKIALFLLIFGAVQVMAQGGVVTGTVTDENGESLPGATISIKGTSLGTISDLDGHYTITTDDPAAILVFSFVGMITQEITVGSSVEINVTLLVDSESLEEVVVVGYGVQKKANLTGAVASVDVAKTLEAKPVADVGKSLQGVVSGVTIIYPNGNLNQEPNIKLRGYGSVNGSSNPLVLIDGVEGLLSDVNPEAIANISVLKDAASSSIYGARAAFGVILVTTKEGQAGKTVVNYSNNFSINKPMWDIQHAHMSPLMDAIHVAKDRNNGGSPFAFGMGGTDWRNKSIAWEEEYGYLGSKLSDETMVEGRDFEVIGGQFYSYRSWDVFGQMLQDDAFAQTHNLSVNGGSETVKYSLSYAYNAKEGAYKVNTQTMDKHNINLNLSADICDWATVNFRSMYTKKTYEEPFNYRSGAYGYLFYATRWISNFPYGVSDGTVYGAPEGSSFIGPIGFLREANRNHLEREYSRNTVETIFDVFTREDQDLNFTANFSYSHWNEVNHEKGGAVPLINWWSQGNPPQYDPLYYSTSTARNQTTYETRNNELYTFNAFANYTNTSFEGHTITALGGVNIEKNEYGYIYSKRPFLLDPGMPELALATGDPETNNSKADWGVLGFFGRINYNFNNKILLEFNGRMDGSSRFPAGDRFAFFPSMSAGYKISEEDFASGLGNIGINNLKLRASWGSIGYQDVGQYAFIPTISDTEADWIVASAREKTFGNPAAVSPSLTWETIKTLDFGLDMGLFGNKIEVIFDWYQRTNEDMLGPGSQLPVTFGASVPRVNAGEMQTRGWELTINGKHRFSDDFNVYATFVLSDATAKITKWSNESGILSDYYEGKVLGEIWGFETDRLFQAEDFDGTGALLADIPVQDPNMYSGAFNIGPGDVKYVDLNGDGLINKGAYTLEDHGDMKVIGNITPKYEYSMRLGAGFKGIDFSALLQGVGKRDYWAMGNVALANYHYDVLYEHQTDYWREDNTDAFYPRPFASNHGNYFADQKNLGVLTKYGYMRMYGRNNYVPQTKYLQNIAYLRLKELTLGYTLPDNLVERVKIEKMRVYFSAYNVLEWSGSWIPVDPETTSNVSSWYDFYGNSMPQSRSFSIGLQVTL